jgi:hypothetical protein
MALLEAPLIPLHALADDLVCVLDTQEVAHFNALFHNVPVVLEKPLELLFLVIGQVG